MLTLDQHLALILAEHQQSLDAPLSARRVMLVAVLLDHFVDRVFERSRYQPERVFGPADVLAYRAESARQSPAIATVFALASGTQTVRISIDPVKVPFSDYPRLGVEDYMVSLYNQNSVQRVLLTTPDGQQHLAHDVLAEAIKFLRDSVLSSAR